MIDDGFDEFDHDREGERPWCERCHNTGDIDCFCGGDLCVCGGVNGDGTDPCPDCDR